MEEPGKSRINIRDLTEGVVIEIPGKKPFILIIFLSLWLVGWALGEVTVSSLLMQEARNGSFLMQGHHWFLILWLCLWTAFGLFGLFAVLWCLFGREEIAFSRHGFGRDNISYGIGGLSIRYVMLISVSKKMYDINSIEKFRSLPEEIRPSTGSEDTNQPHGRARLAFNYGAKTVKFGYELEGTDVERVVDALKKHLPKRVFANS